MQERQMGMEIMRPAHFVEIELLMTVRNVMLTVSVLPVPEIKLPTTRPKS